MKYKELAKEMYEMVNSGQAMDAFEKFYHEDTTMIEATGEVRKGKAESREFEQGFVDSIKEYHGGGVHAITSDEENGISMVEAWMEATFVDGKRIKMEEIARQKWQGDQIIEERFYYNPGPMDS
jgi:hypothetical protein